MKAQAKGNDVITNVISTNQHFVLIFLCRYLNSRDIIASYPSFSSPPPEHPRELAHRLDIGIDNFSKAFVTKHNRRMDVPRVHPLWVERIYMVRE